MNLGELKKAIRFNVEETKSGDLATDAEFINLINRAYQHVYLKLLSFNYYSIINTVTLNFDKAEKDLPEVPQRIVSIVDIDGQPVELLLTEYAPRSTNRAVYLTHYIDGGIQKARLGWYKSVNTTFDLVVKYVPKVRKFAANDPDITELQYVPEEYHSVIVNYATILLIGRDEDNASFWYKIYQESLADMFETLSEKNPRNAAVVDLYHEDC